MPFDVGNFVEVEAPNKEELRILDEMARTPWCQFKFRFREGYCIIGALLKADGLEHLLDDKKNYDAIAWSAPASRVKAALENAAYVAPDHLAVFNDHMADSFDDVLKVYVSARKSFE